MKWILPYLYFSIIVCQIEATTQFPMLNRLPEDSLIRQQSLVIERSFLFKTKKEKAFALLDKKLNHVYTTGGTKETPYHDPLSVAWNILASKSNDDENKEAIRTILPDQSDEIKYKEYDMVNRLAYQLLKEYEESKKEEKRKQEEAKKQRVF